MTKMRAIRHKFVEAIPDTIQDGVLYVSSEYETAVHKCCCGCGQEVVTPLGPTDWRVTVRGDTVSVHPSIGNWSFPCRSHYWIHYSRVRWAEQWSEAQIRNGRMRDREGKQRQYGERPESREGRPGFWAWLWRLISGR